MNRVVLVVAIVLAVCADFIATIPTIIKTYKEPYSETPIAWLAVTVAGTLSIFSTTLFDIANLLYPLYLVAIAGLVWGLAYFGRRVKSVS